MKNQIIRLLKEKGDYVSGQEFCEQFGVSRTAIWKNMKQLKAEGYQIDSVNNRGYKLVAEPNHLSVIEISSFLETEWLGKNIILENTMDSTNTRAKLFGENGAPNGSVILTDCQTAGRGRRGKNWISPHGVNIYFSVLIRPELLAKNASMITLVAAISLARAIWKETNLSVEIKWPNDIVINGKKVCGILTESSTDMEYINYVVVGIGINCNQNEFEEEIQSMASSLFLESGHYVNRNRLLATFLNQFEKYYEIFMKKQDLSDLVNEYNAMLVNRGKQVKMIEKDKEIIRKAIGIDHTGALIVEDENGIRELILSGEVSVRGLYGYV